MYDIRSLLRRKNKFTGFRKTRETQRIKGVHSHGQISNFYVGRSTGIQYVSKEHLYYSTALLHETHSLLKRANISPSISTNTQANQTHETRPLERAALERLCVNKRGQPPADTPVLQHKHAAS